MPTGTEIMNRAAVLLNDAAHIRWPAAELCEWINEATRAIVLAKPSACSTTARLALGVGTKQNLPPVVTNFGATFAPLLLLGLVRNIDIAGDGGDRMIKRTDRALLDAADPDWHNHTRNRFRREVRQYCYDELVPLEYYVYPGNDGTGVVEVEVATLPAPLAAVGDATLVASYSGNISLPEPYSVPILDYVLYRCQMKDDLDGQAGRSAAHYQQFATAIGMKLQVEKAHSPNARP